MIDFTNIISKSWFWKIILFWIPNKNVFISRFHNYIFINWSWLWKGTLGNGCRSTIAECQLSTSTLAKGGKLQCIKFKVAIFKFQNFFLHEYGHFSCSAFYLVILHLSIRWALMKYRIKLLGATKIQGFYQDFYRYNLLLYP